MRFKEIFGRISIFIFTHKNDLTEKKLNAKV